MILFFHRKKYFNTKSKHRTEALMKFIKCPVCGSHLDYGEKCDCAEEREEQKCSKEKQEKTEPAACRTSK